MDLVSVASFIIIVGLVFTAAFFQFSILVWTLLIGITLLIFTFILPTFPILLFAYWLFFLPIALFANLHQFRQRYIVLPALKHLRKQMPAISQTEREALNAGNVWWEKELFSGAPDWKKLVDLPKPSLTQEEQAFLDHQVNHLCSILNDWEIVHGNRDLPEQVWSYLKQEKFFGMVIPKKYGGLGFSALAHSTVILKIATRSVSAAVNTMVPNSLGPAELLLHYGTDEQKDYYLPRLASGLEIPCFALTAPEAGSDASSLPDTGIVTYGEFEGTNVIGIRLSWDKRYITLAPIATVLGLAFRLFDPEQLLGDKVEIGITLCLIPTSHPGVEIGNRHYPLNLAFMNGPTRGKDVFIPMDWIIGGTGMAGQGWRMLMECLSIGRSISLPALATACGKMAYRYTGAYARVRRQFNSPIAQFEGIEEALSHIAGYTYLLEAVRIMTAGAVDLQIKPSIASAIAKYHMTELSRQVVSNAMDIHAGHMIQLGPRNFLANVYFAVPISITVEGANILTRNLIIFGQGAIRCHPFLLKEIELILQPNPDVVALDQILLSHLGLIVRNIFRNIGYGITGGRFIRATRIFKPRIRWYERQLTRMSAALALLADISLALLGGDFKRKERISARLGDIMSQLYLSSAVLKYFHDQNQPLSDEDYVCWTLQHCLQKIEIASHELFHNFPNRFVGGLLKWIIFPFGSSFFKPRDYLGKRLVSMMLQPSEFRDRLTQYCYQSNNSTDLNHQLDQALKQVNMIEPIWKKLHKAIKAGTISAYLSFSESIKFAVEKGLLTPEEEKLLFEYESLKDEIIKVNEFSFDLNTVIA